MERKKSLETVDSRGDQWHRKLTASGRSKRNNVKSVLVLSSESNSEESQTLRICEDSGSDVLILRESSDGREVDINLCTKTHCIRHRSNLGYKHLGPTPT